MKAFTGAPWEPAAAWLRHVIELVLDPDQRFGHGRVDEVGEFQFRRLAALLFRHDHGEIVISAHERGGHLIEKPGAEFRRHVGPQGQSVGKPLHGGLKLFVHGIDRGVEEFGLFGRQFQAVEPLRPCDLHAGRPQLLGLFDACFEIFR
jgi:hypothetical protein